MNAAESKMLAETCSNVKVMVAMHTECHKERVANTMAINGNGKDGLKSDVGALKKDTRSLKSTRTWAVRVGITTLVSCALGLCVYIFQHLVRH